MAKGHGKAEVKGQKAKVKTSGPLGSARFIAARQSGTGNPACEHAAGRIAQSIGGPHAGAWLGWPWHNTGSGPAGALEVEAALCRHVVGQMHYYPAHGQKPPLQYLQNSYPSPTSNLI
jgi:hypothetical protein